MARSHFSKKRGKKNAQSGSSYLRMSVYEQIVTIRSQIITHSLSLLYVCLIADRYISPTVS